MDEYPWRSEDGKLWLDVSCLRTVLTGQTSESLFDSFHRLFHELHFRSRDGLCLFFHAFRVILRKCLELQSLLFLFSYTSAGLTLELQNASGGPFHGGTQPYAVCSVGLPTTIMQYNSPSDCTYIEVYSKPPAPPTPVRAHQYMYSPSPHLPNLCVA